jgi:hypothetical protein
MKTYFPILTAISLTGVLAPLQAALISVEPVSQTVAVGAPVQVAVTVSGLASGAAPSLSAFDLDLTYDPTVLQFTSLTFGDPVLGDQLDLSAPPLGTVTGYDALVPGLVNHFELSLDSVPTLDSLQAGDFKLTVFHFTALAPGVSPLSVAVNSFGDALGDPLPTTVAGGNVTVVPEPEAAELLFAAGLTAWVVVRRGRNRS